MGVHGIVRTLPVLQLTRRRVDIYAPRGDWLTEGAYKVSFYAMTETTPQVIGRSLAWRKGSRLFASEGHSQYLPPTSQNYVGGDQHSKGECWLAVGAQLLQSVPTAGENGEEQLCSTSRRTCLRHVAHGSLTPLLWYTRINLRSPYTGQNLQAPGKTSTESRDQLIHPLRCAELHNKIVRRGLARQRQKL